MSHCIASKITTGRAARVLCAALLLTIAAAAQERGAKERAAPDVVIFIADDMTYTDLGCQGNADVRTPNLDALAHEGMRLTRCYAPAPMCAPARAALYTGLFPVRNGAYPNHSRVHPGTESLPHHLGRAGYRVGLSGKTHFAPAQAFPFERLRPAPGRAGGSGGSGRGGGGSELAWRQIGEFIARDREQPFCLVVASHQPHTPWNQGDAGRFVPAELTLPPYLADTAQTRAALGRYYAEIEFLDGQVGRCVKLVAEHGEPADTLFLFLSEQGSAFPHCKWTCYETGIRAAAIARWPGVVRPGRVSEALIQYVDVLPTLLEAAGAEPAEAAAAAGAAEHVDELDGRSFLDVLRGRTDRHRDYVFGIQTSRGINSGPEAFGIRSICDGRYKLIWNLDSQNEFSNNITVLNRGGFFASWRAAAADGDERAARLCGAFLRRPEIELYDLDADPFELGDLGAQPGHAERIDSLRDELRRFMEQQGDAGRQTEARAKERQRQRRRNR